MATTLQQRWAPWYLFNSFTREAGSTNIILGHLLLEATGKSLGDEKALLDFFDGSKIQDFSDAAIVLY